MSAEWIEADWPVPDGIVAGTTLRGCDDFRFPAPPFWLTQVHGARALRIGADDSGGSIPPEADASVTDRTGIACAVRTADCLPILLASLEGGEVGAAHAGWRGLAAGVAENTVLALRAEPGELIAWLGPAISQANFEVGDEVREAFVAHDPAAEAAFEPNARGRWQADLYTLARQRLAAAGVTRVFGGGLCTYADPARFFSFRREGSTGRLVSFICRIA